MFYKCIEIYKNVWKYSYWGYHGFNYEGKTPYLYGVF